MLFKFMFSGRAIILVLIPRPRRGSVTRNVFVLKAWDIICIRVPITFRFCIIQTAVLSASESRPGIRFRRILVPITNG